VSAADPPDEEIRVRDDIPATPQPPQPPRMSRLVTWLAALVLLPGIVFLAVPATMESRLDTVGDAEEALARIVGRTMDLREAIARRPAWERWTYVALGLEGADDVGQALEWYDELAAHSVDPRVDFHFAILEAEAGRFAAVQQRLVEWERRDAPMPELAGLLASAYFTPTGTVPPDHEALIEQWLGEGWFADRLTIALARRAGDAVAALRAAAALEARADALLARVAVVVAGTFLLAGLGFVALVPALRALRRDDGALETGRAPLPPPWPGRRGAAVLLRAGAAATLLTLALLGVTLLTGPLLAVTGWDVLVEPALEVGTGVFLAVPAVVLARRWLFVPAALPTADALGLSIRAGTGARLGLVTLAAIGVVAGGDLVFAVIADLAGATGHWTEWYQEELVFGSVVDVAWSVLAAVVVAAVTEEIVFRGLLFPTLRRRFGWVLAALLSALAFAALHGYTVQGFASVAWSGFVWAWTYERTRSLWPAMIGHAVGNFSASALVLIALR
jgi:membrane protease YdiL (CAAX protease family)